MNESIQQENIIIFKEGIPGFEHLTKFVLIEEGDGVFFYLQSVEESSILFPVINPHLIKVDYAPHIQERYFDKLGGGESEAFVLYTIATLREPVGESTVNLQAPLLIHVERRMGIQVIAEDKTYHTRHKIADLMAERSASMC
ncbi:MAG: flagellar assembly protein FliW [Cellulosilyticaceae bacterium]